MTLSTPRDRGMNPHKQIKAIKPQVRVLCVLCGFSSSSTLTIHNPAPRTKLDPQIQMKIKNHKGTRRKEDEVQ
jgi:hypothetical protein